jgi:PAS domain S-box-containing protein
MAPPIARILIVEDDSSITLLSTKILERLGYAIVGIAASGDEAIQQAQQTHPDLALVDIKLRGAKDGIETVTQLRASLDLAVVYLTGHSDEETLRRAKETEPDGYLVKPILEINLQVGIEMALHRHKMQQSLRDSEEKWRAVIEQSQDGIILMDKQGQLIEWNQAQEQITGLPRSQVIGRPLWDVQYHAAPAERRRISGLYEQIKAGYEEFFTEGNASWLGRPLEHEIERPDGTRRFVQTTPFAIKTSQGMMVAGITRDITASKRLRPTWKNKVKLAL